MSDTPTYEVEIYTDGKLIHIEPVFGGWMSTYEVTEAFKGSTFVIRHLKKVMKP